MENVFVLPAPNRCIDGKDHWFQTFIFTIDPELGIVTTGVPAKAVNWCRECGIYTKGSPYFDSKPVYPKIYSMLADVLKRREKGEAPAKLPSKFRVPDENTCIDGEKHRFKKAYEMITKKEPKESKVIEICELCGTLTVSKYKYTPGPLGTSNKTKISRVRRRVYAGDAETNRLNYALVPDIYQKLERGVHVCHIPYEENLFWWYANFYDTASWMEDINTSPIAVGTKPQSRIKPPTEAWKPAAPTEHWSS